MVAKRQWVFQSVKAGILGLILSCIGVLVLALIAKFTNLGDSVLSIVNQVIKIVCLAVAIGICLKDGQYLPKAIVAAIIFWLLSLALFLIFGGNVKFGQVVLDLVICLLIGGIVAVVKSKRR